MQPLRSDDMCPVGKLYRSRVVERCPLPPGGSGSLGFSVPVCLPKVCPFRACIGGRLCGRCVVASEVRGLSFLMARGP